MSWKEFYFEGNLWWGKVASSEDWEKLKAAYKGSDSEGLLKAQQHRLGGDNFGTYSEHSGVKTLGEFLKENSIEPYKR